MSDCALPVLLLFFRRIASLKLLHFDFYFFSVFLHFPSLRLYISHLEKMYNFEFILHPDISFFILYLNHVNFSRSCHVFNFCLATSCMVYLVLHSFSTADTFPLIIMTIIIIILILIPVSFLVSHEGEQHDNTHRLSRTLIRRTEQAI